MNKQVILSIESKDSVFKEYRWFWVRSVLILCQKTMQKLALIISKESEYSLPPIIKRVSLHTKAYP